MSSPLHDLLHKLVDRLPFPSQAHREAAHADVDAIPQYVEQLGDEQLDAEQPVDEPLGTDTSKGKQA